MSSVNGEWTLPGMGSTGKPEVGHWSVYQLQIYSRHVLWWRSYYSRLHGFDLCQATGEIRMDQQQWRFKGQRPSSQLLIVFESFVKHVFGYPQDPSGNLISTNSSWSTCGWFSCSRWSFQLPGCQRLFPIERCFFILGVPLNQSRGSDCSWQMGWHR